jgi:hypothetical protein
MPSLTDMLSLFDKRVARRRIHQKPRTLAELRQVAAELVSQVTGRPQERVQENPTLCALPALALLLPEPRVRHEIRPSAAALINGTALHSLPDVLPSLLRMPGVAEVRRPASECLYGNVAGIGWFEFEGWFYVVATREPYGVAVFILKPQWWRKSLDDLAAQEERSRVDVHPIAPDVFAQYGSSGVDALRWLITFGLLLDADRQPLEIRDAAAERPRKAKKFGQARSGSWIVRRYVHLDGHARSTEPGDGERSARSTEGLVSVTSRIRGHLKRHRCGPGHAETKWIYVSDYDARRYVADRPHDLVVVNKKGGAR